MKNILVATDGSESAADAVDAAIELAQQMGAKLQVLAVRPPLLHGRAGSGPAMTEIEELHGSEHIADAAVQRARAAGVESAPHVNHGPVAECIVQVATEVGAELLVVGSRGMGAVHGALVGSVSHALVSRSPIPVMIVRHRAVAAAVKS
jgi:nucleotide-binding universal stress UspA family protein